MESAQNAIVLRVIVEPQHPLICRDNGYFVACGDFTIHSDE
jgi:hypothetical protein